LRETKQKCSHNGYEISALHAELGLRDVPGKSIQRSRQTERLHRLIAGATRLDPAAGKVIGIPRSPCRLLLPPAQSLARRLAASPLSGTNSIVGTKPATADAARALPGNGHDEPSSKSPAQILSGKLGYRPGGSLLESRPGSLSESAEGDAVYLRNSRYVPPRWEAVRDAMPALFDLIEAESEPSVRAVLGHWLFGYIHPYPDGNGRMARFLMNVLLASGGYPWTVVRVEDRTEYLKALDRASIDVDARPFASFIAERVRWSLKKTKRSLGS
jgi:hypothetical protein